ncbi:MAG: lytic transglycosylase domain-containing protein, partial [Chitinophagaceae bacterium]|nr:lytic transglycosylase domain-containing protein [Chitinophagaceae bacterium]
TINLNHNKKDSNLIQLSAHTTDDPKEALKKFLNVALKGDDVTGVRLNPAAVSFVEKYISQYKKNYLELKQKKGHHLQLMEQILEQHGVPGEMKYLAVIESHLNPYITSPAGARGPWQFMPETARKYGLRITQRTDERCDYYKSTHAAARMLTELFTEFGDWLLVLAAYNGGPGNVYKAIRKSGGSKNFWTLQHYLPNESMKHVKKFIATHYIFEGEGGITTLTKDETRNLMNKSLQLSAEELKKTVAYDISGRFRSDVILKHIQMDKKEFDRLNPGFDQEIALHGKYNLRLPQREMNLFIEKRYEILEESLQQLIKQDLSGFRP